MDLHDNETTLPSNESSEDCEPFRFLDLPAEVRNRIYSFIVADLTPERGCHDLSKFALPILSHVNWQIRAEVLPIFFAESSFRVIIDSNFSDRMVVRTNASRLDFCSASKAKKCGVLRVKRRLKSTLQGMKECAVFRNVTLKVYDTSPWTDVTVKVVLTCENGQLRMTSEEGRWHPSQEEYWTSKYEKVDIDAAVEDASRIVDRFARHGSAPGFTLLQLERIARAFRFGP